MSDAKKSEARAKSATVTDDFEFHLEDAEKPSIIHVILLNRTLRILCALGVFCMLIPTLDYFYFYSTEIAEYEIDDSGICSHYPIYQIPCGGSENISEAECIANACCYSTATGCYHFLPSKYQLRAPERPWSGGERLVPTREQSPLKTKTFASMRLDFERESHEIVSILLWNPSLTSPVRRGGSESARVNPKYDIKVFSPDIFVEVRRVIDNQTVLSTARGALIASENYFEWSIYLGGNGDNVKLMGFDEVDLHEGRRILINNGHSSVIPYVVVYDRTSKQYHAVHFESIDSPAELQILKSNTIIVRQYSSASFRVRVCMGPAYGDVYRQLKSVQRRHSLSPTRAHWPLGVHFCHTSAVRNETEMRLELSHLLQQALPFDSHCISSELTALALSNGVESVLAGYRTILEDFKRAGKKFLLHLTLTAIDVGIIDDELRELLFKGEEDEMPLIGLLGRSRKVAYLDYITKSLEIAEWLRKKRLDFSSADGFLLMRGFPFDDTISKSLDYLENFAFAPRNFAREISGLIPLNVQLNDSSELLLHQLNNYGRQQIEVFQRTLNGGEREKFCVADSFRESSTSCGMLIRVECATWTSFQAAVSKIVFYSLVGMPFYGAEVCGGNGSGDAAEDLCVRWYQFAIFTPLFYVDSQRQPTKFSKFAERLMVHAIRTRYSLLAYLRTCMANSARTPLLRPLRYVDFNANKEEEENEEEEAMRSQLMFGEALMIAPVTEPLVVAMDLRFPERFFELWSGMEMPRSTHFSIVMHDIPIFIRAGHIVALHLAHNSTSAEDAQLQPYLVVVALACSERFVCRARGRQQAGGSGVEFWFEATERQLNITVIAAAGEEGRENLCGTEPVASSKFRLAKIYGLDDFEESTQQIGGHRRRRSNDYLSLDLNVCDAAWSGAFTIAL